MKQNVLRIGFVLRPQGIRGELKVEPLTDHPRRFSDAKEVLLEQEGQYTPVRMTTNRITGDAVYVYLEGYYTRDAAEKLRGAYICVPREQAVPLPEGSWFVCDLLGLSVRTQSQTIGTLCDVIRTGAVDVYEVKKEAGGTLRFPALKRVIVQVDIEQGIMLLDEQALSEVRIDAD